MSTTTQWGEDPGVASGLRDALRSLTVGALGVGELWRLGEDEVVAALSVVGQVRQALEVAEVALVGEGLARGLPDQGSWSVHDWVSTAEGRAAPVPPVRHVASVARLGGAGVTGSPGSAALAGVREVFGEGDLSLASADQLVRFHARVAPVADGELLEHDLRVLLAGARDDVAATGPQGRRIERVRGMGEKELAAAITRTGRLLRPPRDQDREDRRAKAARSLTKSAGPVGLSCYRVVLDAEGAAVLDSAIAALSAPVPGPVAGERGERPAAQRRADALVEVVRRGVSAPGAAPRCDKAQV